MTLFALLFIGLSISSHNADAANDYSFAPLSTPASSVDSCPSGHKMYYIGANPPKYSPIATQPLSWNAGSTNKDFTFTEPSGNKIFKIKFSNLDDLNTDNGQPPFYGSIDGVTSSALNLEHNSTSAKTNHVLDIKVNRSVSKTGYKIQDLDSTTVSVRVGGFFSLVMKIKHHISKK